MAWTSTKLAPPQSMTWEAWINQIRSVLMSTGQKYSLVLEIRTWDGGLCSCVGKALLPLDAVKMEITSRIQFAFFAGENDRGLQRLSSSTGHVNRGDWNHVAITVYFIGNGKQITFYINGTKSGSYFSDAYRIGDGGGENTDEDVMLGFSSFSSCRND